MFSLQRLLGRPNEFFGLLEQSAACGARAAAAVQQIVSQPDKTPDLSELVAARRAGKEVFQQLEEKLGRVFITPIEREDLEEVAQRLYGIPKMAEKFAERYEIVWEQVKDVDYGTGAKLFTDAVGIVQEMVSSLRQVGNLAQIKSLDARLSQIESDASHILLEASRRLYAPGIPPLKIIIAKELFDILTNCIEHCRALGRALALVVLRNS